MLAPPSLPEPAAVGANPFGDDFGVGDRLMAVAVGYGVGGAARALRGEDVEVYRACPADAIATALPLPIELGSRRGANHFFAAGIGFVEDAHLFDVLRGDALLLGGCSGGGLSTGLQASLDAGALFRGQLRQHAIGHGEAAPAGESDGFFPEAGVDPWGHILAPRGNCGQQGKAENNAFHREFSLRRHGEVHCAVHDVEITRWGMPVKGSECDSCLTREANERREVTSIADSEFRE